MNALLQQATKPLADFLESKLPPLSPDWWEKHVIKRLTFAQQRMAEQRGFSSLKQFDLAALLRLLDHNWRDISVAFEEPLVVRNWVKELQTVRNKWAHLPAEGMPPSETFRDADTLGRLMTALGADEESIAAVEARKSEAVVAMSASRTVPEEEQSPIDPPVETPEGADSSNPEGALFKAGDLVVLRSKPDALMPIIEVLPDGPACRYRVFRNNAQETFFETQLQLPLSTTGEQPVVTVEALHAHLTSLQLGSPSTANLFSLRSGRVRFVPYQYRPVLKLIRADRPRLLIADEVGVGKTIEAGLIIKELRARMDISSVLIICPKTLVSERKWFLEMKRFDEDFTALDGPLLRHCLQETHLDGEWPDQYAKAILPFSLFDSDLLLGTDRKTRRRVQGLLELDTPPKFDLVIVDEAHHIRNPETFSHQAVRYFCDHAHAVLFLTATPVQLGSKDLFTLLNVLRPDLVIDDASFEQMAAPNPFINRAIQHCRTKDEDWRLEARARLDDAAQTDWGKRFIRESPKFQAAYDRLAEDDLGDVDRIGLIQDLEEMYTFSPLINRTRRRDIGEFTTRNPTTLSVEFTPSQESLHNALMSVVARILAARHGDQNVKFMMTTIRRQAASCLYGLAPLLEGILAGQLNRLEMIDEFGGDGHVDLGFVEEVRDDIQALLEAAKNLDPHDPKVDAFVQVLQEKAKSSKNKALVFSTFLHTLAHLAKHTEQTGLRYGVIHGKVPDDERVELRRRFALPKENPDALDVLLSSEVGCEGLDYQFCDLLINYDLPWNPMRVEQRIGRIDRYGQESESIAIVNLITPGTVDADIYERCLMRIGIFKHTVGGSEEILGRLTQEVHDIAESFTLSTEAREEKLKQLSDNAILEIQVEQELEANQAELFGLNLPKKDWNQELEASDSQWLSPQALRHCVASYLRARVGNEGEYLLGDTGRITLRLNQEARSTILADYRALKRSSDAVSLRWGKWLKGAEPTLGVTFEQETAAEDSTADFLSVLHPLVQQAAKHLFPSEPVPVHLRVDSETVPPGEYPFAVYRWQYHGVVANEEIIAVATDPQAEESLMALLPSVTDNSPTAKLSEEVREELEQRHHARWTAAQANHIAQNREFVEHRIQSLEASHDSRCEVIQTQISRTQDEKIRRMKNGELTRADADYARRMAELEAAGNSGDIHAKQVVYGLLSVERGVA